MPRRLLSRWWFWPNNNISKTSTTDTIQSCSDTLPNKFSIEAPSDDDSGVSTDEEHDYDVTNDAIKREVGPGDHIAVFPENDPRFGISKNSFNVRVHYCVK